MVSIGWPTSPMGNSMMMIGIIMGSRQLFDFEDPDTVFWLRVVVAISYGLMGGMMLFWYVQIITSPTKDKKVFVKPSQLRSAEFQMMLDPNDPDEKKEMTYREYDTYKLGEFVQKFVMTSSITMFIHLYFGLTPPLIANLIVQPRMLSQTQFFKLFVLKMDEKIHRDLRRPWPQPAPSKMQNYMKEWQKSLEEEAQQAENAKAAPGTVAKQPANRATRRAAKRAEKKKK